MKVWFNLSFNPHSCHYDPVYTVYILVTLFLHYLSCFRFCLSIYSLLHSLLFSSIRLYFRVFKAVFVFTVYAWDSEKHNFNCFVCQVHVKKLTNKTDFHFDFKLVSGRQTTRLMPTLNKTFRSSYLFITSMLTTQALKSSKGSNLLPLVFLSLLTFLFLFFN